MLYRSIVEILKILKRTDLTDIDKANDIKIITNYKPKPPNIFGITAHSQCIASIVFNKYINVTVRFTPVENTLNVYVSLSYGIIRHEIERIQKEDHKEGNVIMINFNKTNSIIDKFVRSLSSCVNIDVVEFYKIEENTIANKTTRNGLQICNMQKSTNVLLQSIMMTLVMIHRDTKLLSETFNTEDLLHIKRTNDAKSIHIPIKKIFTRSL